MQLNRVQALPIKGAGGKVAGGIDLCRWFSTAVQQAVRDETGSAHLKKGRRKKLYCNIGRLHEVEQVFGGIHGYLNQTSSDDWAPSPALCYVIGAVLGDGHVCKQAKSGRYYVRLVVEDESFAKRFADALRQLGIKPHVCFYEGNGMWVVVVYSKLFAGYLKRLDLNAIGAMCSAPDLVSAFIAGFYESEGYISIIRRSDRKGSWKPILSIGNTNLGLLRLAQRLLSSLGLTFHIYKQYDAKQMLISGRLVKRKALYVLTTQSALTAGRFFEIIRPCIKLPKIEIPNVNQRIAERSIARGIDGKLILKIKKLRAQGLSYKKIGSVCGVSSSTAWRQDRR